ncbi:MAG: large subunit ribosomal protein L22 [Myxococcota bacterium]|jgi:large subunit ribosomal protein L22
MEAKATLKYIRIAPRKVRVVLNAIRDTPDAEIALASLKFQDKRAAQLIHKLLASAVANAGTKFGVNDPGRLYIKEAFANEGPTLRRFRPRAMGRATRINKRTSHITLVVAERD